MPTWTHAIARFPFLNAECPDVTDWLCDTILWAKQDPRISGILRLRYDDTPITMTRNKALKTALLQGVDFLTMIDSDMNPDIYLESNQNKLGNDPLAKPFFETAFNFLLSKNEPAVIAAPYCGPPPNEMPYIFQWKNHESGQPNPDIKLEMFSREDAAHRRGIEEVAALPTGLIMIDMRAIKLTAPTGKKKRQVLEELQQGKIDVDQAMRDIEQGWTYYEWQDNYAAEKASTEDVTFTRDLSLCGVKLYSAWDCWAGHWKRKCVGKPIMIYADQIGERYSKAKQRNMKSNERMMIIGGNGAGPVPAHK